MTQRIAIVTPTCSRDAELCADLNRSVLEMTDGWVHYLIVQRREMVDFAKLAGPRTVVVATEEWVPRSFRSVPGSNWWVTPYSLRPFSGWLMQQIVKLSAACHVEEDVLVCMDSDLMVVRELGIGDYVVDDAIRLHRRPGGIRPDMARHIEWHTNVCRLLGVEPDTAPMDDYISPTVSWGSALVRAACERVESVTGRSWYAAIARTPQFSEGLFYGAYVTKVLGDQAPVWFDESDRCLNWWEMSPLTAGRVDEFVRGFAKDDLAVMISSHSDTSVPVRRQVASRLSGGRLWPEEPSAG